MISLLALLVATAAPAAPAPALAPGTYRFNATYQGAPVGGSTLTVTRDASGTTIKESATGSAGGLDFAATATLVLGADLAPTLYDGKYKVMGQDADASVNLTPTTATVKSSAAAGGPQTFALDPQSSHFVIIEPGLVSGFFALPAQMQTWSGATVSAIAPAYSREVPITPEAAASPAPTRPNGVPAGDVPLSVGGHLPFTIWYDPTTLVPDEIVVPSQNATATRVRN